MALHEYFSNENSSKTGISQNLPTQASGSALNKGTAPRRQWLSSPELKKVSELLKKRLNPEHQLCFQIAVSTGQRFKQIRHIQWQDFNARTGTLRMGDNSLTIHPELCKELATLRERAEHPEETILNIQYENFFRVLKSCFVRAGINQKQCARLLRNTYIRRHWQAYQNKALLKKQLGIKSLRRLPKSLFEVQPVALNLFPEIG